MDCGIAEGTTLAVSVTGTGLASVGIIGVKVVVGCDIAEITVGEGLTGSVTETSNGWQANRRPTWVSMNTTCLDKRLPQNLLVGISFCHVDNQDEKEYFSHDPVVPIAHRFKMPNDWH